VTNWGLMILISTFFVRICLFHQLHYKLMFHSMIIRLEWLITLNGIGSIKLRFQLILVRIASRSAECRQMMRKNIGWFLWLGQGRGRNGILGHRTGVEFAFVGLPQMKELTVLGSHHNLPSQLRNKRLWMIWKRYSN